MNAPTKTAEVVQLPAISSGGKVNPIVPANWQEITAIAGAICRANMAPKSYCKTDNYGKLIYVDGATVPYPDKVAIAIMHGLKVGLTPMASLQSLAVINGMPGLYGDGLMAVVRASGQLEDLQEGLEVDDQGKPTMAWCKVKRKGEASWKERTLTFVECMRAGWTEKAGPWKLTPGRMMMVRVRGWLLRDMFADVLRGLHSAEELQDQAMVDITPPAATVAAPEEPKRGDFVETPKETPPADPKAKPEKPKRAAAHKGKKDEPPKDTPPGGDKPADQKPGITDAVDENDKPAADAPEKDPKKPGPGEKLEFNRFTKTVEFMDFAEEFLPSTNTEGAIQFMAFYDGTLIAMDRGKALTQEGAKRVREMAKELGWVPEGENA